LNGGTGTFNVGRRLGFFVGSHVVYSGKMEKVINITFQGLHGLGIDAEVLAGKVTNDPLHTAFINTPALTQIRQFVLGLFANQNMPSAPTSAALLYQITTDTACAARQEISHS